jgi:hypothetical protein
MKELVINIRKGQPNRCCLLADHLRRAWRLRRVRIHQLITRTQLQLTIRRYNGTSDLQLERMNVYFNEVCTSKAPAYARPTF